MAITNSIKWSIEQTSYELTRDEDCRGVLIYKRADHLPQFFTAKEAATLCVQIRRMLDRSDLVPLNSKLTGG